MTQKVNHKQVKGYQFLPEVILRTPREALSSSFDLDFVKSKLQNTAFLESIYLASPSLYNSIIDLNKGKKVSEKQLSKMYFTCAKYILRSASRSTPFGLFSGLSMLKWGEDQTNILISSDFHRKTKLDMHFLSTLLNALKSHPFIRKQLLFYPNNSHYVFRDEVRFLEYKMEADQRTFQISALEKSEFIEVVLEKATGGIKLDDLYQIFVSDEISISEAEDFVESLVDCQFLESELEPILSGEPLLNHTLNILEKANENGELDGLINTLNLVQEKIEELDKRGINDISDYQNIIDLLARIGIPATRDNLFHVDGLIEPFKDSVLGKKHQEGILKTISKLRSINRVGENKDLNEFKVRFRERFEDEEVPLLTALDVERGVGYGLDSEEAYVPLLEEINLTTPVFEDSKISEDDKFPKVLHQAEIGHKYEIALNDLVQDCDFSGTSLGPSNMVVFRMIGEDKIFLEGLSGPSGVNAISRFAQHNSEINDLVLKIAKKEQDQNEAVLFAEIIHLPDSKSGNVLWRPNLRAYEIPFLASASVKEEFQIHLQDLWVSVQNGNVVLRDSRRNQVIIPRLSSAYNYAKNSLPIFKFLCDLQSQDLQTAIKFDWGKSAKNHSFLPRVSDNGIVVSLATWQFRGKDLLILNEITSDEDFHNWREERKIPLKFVISEGDNDLLIDTSNSFLIALFLDHCKNKKKLLLKEFLMDKSCAIRNEKGELMVNQFLAFLENKDPIYKEIEIEVKPSKKLELTNHKSDWVYFKIYCGAIAADKILTSVIGRMVEEAFKLGLIEKWFFIRYYDPAFHIRLRFKLKNSGSSANFLRLFKEQVSGLINDGMISKIKTSLYEPEISRYGAIGIQNAESFFQSDSSKILSFLNKFEGNEREDKKYLFALKNVDNYLSLFGLALSEKREFILYLRNYFADEFNLDIALKKQLDRKYRQCRNEISNCLKEDGQFEMKDKWLEELIKEFQNEAHEVGLQRKILGGLLHMHVNRLMTINPRLHELIIYDFLYRQYHSEIARIG